MLRYTSTIKREFGKKWSEKYPIVVKSWNNNWSQLSTYFDFSLVVRKAIYTNNPIEAYHRQLRKHTKNKGVFPSEMAIMKLIFLLAKNITAKWTMPMRGWPLVVQQLAIIFDQRLTKHLNILYTPRRPQPRFSKKVLPLLTSKSLRDADEQI